MADRYINLKELLPLYLQAYKELAAPMDAETPEFRAIEAEHNRIIANRYIVTCDEEGIVRYEKLMGIQPKADDTLEDRIFRCITKWNVCLPYNYAFLDQKLRELCGAEYTLDLDIAGQTVTVKVGLAQKNQYDVVTEMLEEVVPWQLTVEYFFTVQSVPDTQTISTYYSGAIYTLGIAEFEHSPEFKCCGREYSGVYNR